MDQWLAYLPRNWKVTDSNSAVDTPTKKGKLKKGGGWCESLHLKRKQIDPVWVWHTFKKNTF